MTKTVLCGLLLGLSIFASTVFSERKSVDDRRPTGFNVPHHAISTINMTKGRPSVNPPAMVWAPATEGKGLEDVHCAMRVSPGQWMCDDGAFRSNDGDAASRIPWR